MATMRGKDPNFPTWRWHPQTGESMICQTEDEIPEGWLPYHPNSRHDARPAPAPVVAPTLDRKAVIAELRAKEVRFNPRESTRALSDLLADLKEHDGDDS